MGTFPAKIYILPGGKAPEPQTAEAIGFDVYLRIIVSAFDMDAQQAQFRKCLFDFKRIPFENPKISSHVVQLPNEKGEQELLFRMQPGTQVLVAVGFVIAMPFPYFGWTAPRSGLASKWYVQLGNAPGTIDPDYRGEAGILVKNLSNDPFDLRQNMRIAQVVFTKAEIPEFEIVNSLDALSDTGRGTGGFGSTGLR